MTTTTTPLPSETPYAELNPDTVLDALDAVGLRGDGRLIQLNSYENRVFQVFLEDGRVVVTKFYRPGRWSDAQILEEHAFANELAAHEIPVAAVWPLRRDDGARLAPRVEMLGDTLARLTTEGGGGAAPAAPAAAAASAAATATLPSSSSSSSYRFSVSARLGGRAPELEDADTLEWLGRFIGRMHAVGALKPFEHRERLSVQTFGINERDWLLGQGLIPPDAETAWAQVTTDALGAVTAAFERGGPARQIRLHGDCHLGNVLWTTEGPHFVDLDDAVTGPAMQDLWMLLSGDRAAMSRQLATVLDGYEQFMDFDRRELRLIEPLRTLRIIRHSAWIARRWADPAFPIAFPWFESPKYWAEQTTRLRQQLEAMSEAPLG